MCIRDRFAIEPKPTFMIISIKIDQNPPMLSLFPSAHLNAQVKIELKCIAVSYTHLDVYKRQVHRSMVNYLLQKDIHLSLFTFTTIFTVFMPFSNSLNL